MGKLKASVIYRDNFKHVESEVLKFVDRAVKKSAFQMERDIKEVATQVIYKNRSKEAAKKYKVTGHLRRSIRAVTQNMPFGSAEVGVNPVREGADTNYAVHLEYGTRYIAPRAFIRKGIGIAKKKIPAIFAEEAKKAKDNVRNGKTK